MCQEMRNDFSAKTMIEHKKSNLKCRQECKKATHRRMWLCINEVKTIFELIHEHNHAFIFCQTFNQKFTALI